MSTRTQTDPLFDASSVPGGKWTFYGGMAAFAAGVGYLLWRQGGHVERRTSLRTGGPGWRAGITLDREIYNIGPGR